MSRQDLALFFVHNAFPKNCRFILHHDRKGLHRAPLEFSKSHDSLLIRRVAAQMISADPFDSCDLAVCQKPAHVPDRIRSSLRASDDIDFGPAVVAADRLGVVASGCRIIILSLTIRTHREFLHRCPAAVIWERIQDRQSRTAGCAVDKRVKVSSVRRIIQLPPAVLAGRDIRRDEYLASLLDALHDLKPPECRRHVIRRLHIDLEDRGTLRRPALQRLQELFDPLCLSLRDDLDVGSAVADRSGDPGLIRKPAHGRPESHALHDPVDPYSFCFSLFHIFPVCGAWPDTAK